MTELKVVYITWQPKIFSPSSSPPNCYSLLVKLDAKNIIALYGIFMQIRDAHLFEGRNKHTLLIRGMIPSLQVAWRSEAN